MEHANGADDGAPSYAHVVREGDAHDTRPDFASEPETLDTAPEPQRNGNGSKDDLTNGAHTDDTPHTPEPPASNDGDDLSYADTLKGDSPNSDHAKHGSLGGAVERQAASAHRNGNGFPTKEKMAVQDGSTKQRRGVARKPKPQSKQDSHAVEKDYNREERRRGHEAAGIHFAPWSIPFKRRLQTLAVLLHSLSIALMVSFFFFLCAIPLTWPLLIPYLVWVLVSNAGTDGRLRYRSERLRRHRWWKLFAGYFPAALHKTTDLPATRKYIFGYHPHGIISHGAWVAFGTDALGFAEKFPGITNSLLTLDSNFRIPLYRDFLLAMGLGSVSKESIGNILTRGGPNNEGMGRAVTIVVGGARESLEAQPGTLRLILRERKGFIKLAVRTGADLVPVIAFGENDLYDQVNPRQHPWVHNLQMFVLRVWKFTLPFLHGRGIFNYDVGLMPYRRPLNIVVGAPIRVAQATGGVVDPAEVERLHGLYCEEVQNIWDRYKDVFAKERIGELQFLK